MENKSSIKKKKNILFVDQEEFYSQVLIPVEETGVLFLLLLFLLIIYLY
ncbi:hypothetical protein M1146_04740 [Patescibacteria group bacterium]|nr:hypothetical protein [Patescibacteria group bacterium]